MKVIGSLANKEPLRNLKFINIGIDNYSEGEIFQALKVHQNCRHILNMDKYMLKLFGRSVLKIKKGSEKFLAEIGWREFNHSLINYFPHMIKETIQKIW